MGIATGTAVAGKVQVEGVALAEGSTVTALAPDSTGEMHFDTVDAAALPDALDDARRGGTISAQQLFARLDARAQP